MPERRVMLTKLLYKIIGKKVKREINQAFQDGLTKGFELGYQLRKQKETKRGFIISPKVDREIDEILRRKGGKG